ncbi:MAG TPA: EcsC family protein [Propionicimonas sp.]|nr:EcsC family protein [Propionicimonas sp.]HQA77450.1 EcsC family protein [Propionicimonas sp.]HQD96427.1 EcsC family protein [Propionicimonas sp.]
MTNEGIGKQVVARAPAVVGGMLRSIVEFAIDGNSSFPGAKATAAKALQTKGEREAAIDSLVTQHIGLASAQGFLTSVGGLLTLPVGLPANIAGMGVLSVRMIASIAHLRGYDVDDRRVRAALTLAMLGDDEVRRMVADGRLPATPLAIATAPMFDPSLDQAINERVMGSLAGRLGGKHLAVVVVRRIPLVGGGVGAAVDGWLTFGLAAYAKREFVARHQASIPRQ